MVQSVSLCECGVGCFVVVPYLSSLYPCVSSLLSLVCLRLFRVLFSCGVTIYVVIVDVIVPVYSKVRGWEGCVAATMTSFSRS